MPQINGHDHAKSLVHKYTHGINFGGGFDDVKALFDYTVALERAAGAENDDCLDLQEDEDEEDNELDSLDSLDSLDDSPETAKTGDVVPLWLLIDGQGNEFGVAAASARLALEKYTATYGTELGDKITETMPSKKQVLV